MGSSGGIVLGSPRAALPLAVALVLAGCATGGGGPTGPVISPTGIEYEPGTPPVETRFSQTAALYLRSDNPERALDLVLQGIDSDPENPIHYFLAGVAKARVGEHEAADAMFAEAQELYPAYELDIEPERESAWADAFNEGSRAYAAGDVNEAIRAWQGAAVIYDLRPEVHRSLAALLSAEGRYDEAIGVYEQAVEGLERRPATRVLDEDELRERRRERTSMEERLAELFLLTERFEEAEPYLRRQLRADPESRQVRRNLALALGRQGRRDEAGEIYDALLSEEELESSELFGLGVALFRSGDYERAGRTFGALAELRPRARDVWFNYANALFAAERWDDLLTVAEQLVELDPLSESAALIAARARVETGDERGALGWLERIGESPVHLEGLVMSHGSEGTSVQGRIVGNRAEPGDTVRLRFTFYGDDGELGSEPLALAAPAPEESEAFEVTIRTRATAYRYEVVPAEPQ
jgi:tetratricopeptide (TPR) repeat protein